MSKNRHKHRQKVYAVVTNQQFILLQTCQYAQKP